MHKCAQGSLIPSYLTNSGTLNLGGITSWGKLVKLSASMGAGAFHDLKLFGQSFHLALDLANPRFGVLVLRRICFLVIALGQYILALILFWWGLIFILGLGTSFHYNRKSFCPPPTTSYCTMRINSNICFFIWANLAGLTLGVESPLVDISLAQDLVMMGSRCSGSLDCFLLATFWS